MKGRFVGKVALVTGGSSGIGRATSILFAREGAKVVVADLNVEEGEGTVSTVKEEGGEALFVKTDVTKTDEVKVMVNTVVQAFGRLDCAFNNAGIAQGVGLPLHQLPEEVWDRVIDVNLKSVWLCMKHEVLQMLKQGGGAIVNNSSTAGIVACPTASAYTASKFGVIGVTKTAAIEYGREGIRVNAVCPGYVMTPFHDPFGGKDNPSYFSDRVEGTVPLGKAGSPEEIAQAVLWLCSDAASYVTGHSMLIDGGMATQSYYRYP